MHAREGVNDKVMKRADGNAVRISAAPSLSVPPPPLPLS